QTAAAAPARPADAPASCDRPPAAPALPVAGAALSNADIPGTAFDTWENSSGLSWDCATPNSAPAAPAACSGVAFSSFDSAPTSSGLAFAASAPAVCSPSHAATPAVATTASATQARDRRLIRVMSRLLPLPLSWRGRVAEPTASTDRVTYVGR